MLGTSSGSGGPSLFGMSRFGTWVELAFLISVKVFF